MSMLHMEHTSRRQCMVMQRCMQQVRQLKREAPRRQLCMRLRLVHYSCVQCIANWWQWPLAMRPTEPNKRLVMRRQPMVSALAWLTPKRWPWRQQQSAKRQIFSINYTNTDYSARTDATLTNLNMFVGWFWFFCCVIEMDAVSWLISIAPKLFNLYIIVGEPPKITSHND